MDDETIEIPLPQDAIETQEIPRVAETLELPEVRETYVVKTVPAHLLGDPILKMDDQPLSTADSVFELVREQTERMVPPPPKPKPVRRHKMRTADKFLLGMGATAAVSVTFIYGMVAYGWGAGPRSGETAPKPHHTYRFPQPVETPYQRPTPSRRPSPTRTLPVEIVVAPRTHHPAPTRSVIVVHSPTPTPSRTSEAPSAPQTPSKTPEPTKTSQSPTESPSAFPTASESPSPASPSITLEP